MNENQPINNFPASGQIHIVGIGGAGMSAIARVLIGRGYTVSGSDRQSGPVIDDLVRDGATFFSGHAADQVNGAAAVLISSAIPDSNPEVMAARAANIPVLKRRDALSAITAGYDVIAVAGTHGKTTTSALIAHLLIATGHSPTYIVGGTLRNTGTNAGVGQSRWFVIEADEYDYMFLGLQPKIALITNIEHDHPDMFPTLADVQNAFQQFAARIVHQPPQLIETQTVETGTRRIWESDSGVLVAAQDDPNVRAIGERLLTEFDWQTHNIFVDWFRLDEAGATLATIGLSADQLPLFGDHNLRNMLAAIHVVQSIVALPDLRQPLLDFKGVARRMEKMGETTRGVTIYSDYGHHSTAIRATLQGLRDRFPERTIWAVWQPHTFSRTHLLAAEFAGAFAAADHALITDIFASREQPTPGPTPADIAHMAGQNGHPDARASGDLRATLAILQVEATTGDVVIIFSAGDGPQIGTWLLAAT